MKNQSLRFFWLIGFVLFATVSMNKVYALAPVLSKSFSPEYVAPAVTTTLTITLSNPNSTIATITGSFVDTLPAGLLASGSGSNTCGGALTVAPSSITLTGGAIPANGSCVIIVSVSAVNSGNYINIAAIGSLTTSNGSNTAAASATLTVPSIRSVAVAKTFSPSTIYVGGSSVITISLINASAITPVAGAVTFGDALPTGLNYSILNNSCGGTLTLTGVALSLTGGTIGSGATGVCQISLSASASASGVYTNIVPAGNLVIAGIGTNADPVSVSLAVADIILPPSLDKFFMPYCVSVHKSSYLIINLGNASSIPAVLTAPFVDRLPHNLNIRRNISNTCGGTLTSSDNMIMLTGGTIPAFGSCSITVEVSSDRPGCYINSIPAGALQTTLGNNLIPVTTELTVVEDHRNHNHE